MLEIGYFIAIEGEDAMQGADTRRAKKKPITEWAKRLHILFMNNPNVVWVRK